MWRGHTCLLVVLSVAVSPLLASQQQKSRVLSHCPSFTPVTLSPKNKVPVPAKQNSVKQTSGGLNLNSVIEVSSDITVNQIWTAGNTYHITAPINVQALLVIEPGTIVELAYNTSMLVNNGGALISAGTPDNPVIYTSDSSDTWYGDYYCAIYIDPTASSSTKITYSYIEYAEIGIWVMNNRLDTPIENNYLYNNTYGILEYGTKHTDIYNYLVYASYYYGIEVHMPSYDNQADSGSHILIQNNTCDYYQDYGIIVFGVANEADSGNVTLSNNIVSNALTYGLALVNGAMNELVTNTGYYGNAADTLYVYTNYDPVYETSMPYVTGTGTLPVCYLNHNSTFVNASDDYIEQTRLIGKTTDINSFPDSNKTDLGFHYPNWQFSNAGASNLTADFDNSYTVDFNDLSAFADYWLYDYNDNYNCWSWDLDDSGLIDLLDFEVIADNWPTSFDFADFTDFAHYWRRAVNYKFQDKRFDFNGDCVVDFKDYVMFASQWRKTTQSTTPPIAVTVSGDSSTGYINIDASGCTPDIMQTYFYVDGQYMGINNDLDVSALGSVVHELKAVSIDINDNIICSNLTQTTFSCPFNYCPSGDSYELSEPYYFHAFYQGSGNVTVSVFDEDKNLAWSQIYPAENVYGFVPPEITSRTDLETIVFTHSSGLSSSMSLNEDIVALDDAHPLTKPCVLSFNPKKVPAGVRALIVLPDSRTSYNLNRGVIDQVKATYDSGSIQSYPLKDSQATSVNLGWCAQNRQIQFIYYDGHGQYKFPSAHGDQYRTAILLSDGICFSVRRSDYPNPSQAPSWCPAMAEIYERGTNVSFAQMGWNSLKFAFFDCCWAGKNIIQGGVITPGPSENSGGIPNSYTNDMYWALNLQSGELGFYQSWDCNEQKGPLSTYSKFVRNEYEQWAQLRSLYFAILDSINKSTPDPADYEEPAERYRLYGHGDIISFQCR
jgi:hypothetical protein